MRKLITPVVMMLLLSSADIIAGSNLFNYFPDIEGFDKPDNIDTYGPDNLYDRINGAADMYLTYEFEELATGTYYKGKEQSLTVEIYKHADSDNGFGIYSQERYGGISNFIDVGAQGYYETGILNFYKDCYYVKLSAYNLEDEENILIQFAKKIEENLPGENTFPEIFNDFPVFNLLLNSQRYIAKNFMGHSFFSKAFTSNYHIRGTDFDYFTYFVIKGDSKEECEEMIRSYLKFLKTPMSEIKQGRYILDDPYYDDVELLWKDNIIKGTYGLTDENIRNQYLTNKIELFKGIKVKGNIAYKKPVSASSLENYAYLAEFVNDGSDESRWSSEFRDPQWITIDLKKAYTFSKVVLIWESSFGKSYDIQVSEDGDNWKTVYSTESGDGNTDEIIFNPVKARFVRMYGKVRIAEWGYSIYEFQVFKE